MSLYIYAPALYPGTQELINILQAKRLIKHDGMHFLRKGTPMEFGAEDRIVCWGAHIPPIPNVPCLNASYKYSRMLDINVRGLSNLVKLGYNAFITEQMTNADYAKALAALKPDQWWPTGKVFKERLVPMREFDGYGTSFYHFRNLCKTLAFRDKIIGEFADAEKMMDALQLNFAELYTGMSGEVHYLLKIITAPTLDAKGVEIVAERILAWANKVKE